MTRNHGSAIALTLEPGSLQPLPLLGQNHPVRRFYERFLYSAAGAAVILHLTLFTVWLVARSAQAPPPGGKIVVVNPVNLIPPPPLVPDNPAEVHPRLVLPADPAAYAVPEPVDDLRADRWTIPTDDEYRDALPPLDLPALNRNPGDSIVVAPSAFEKTGNPLPTDFVPVEERPILIEMPAPIYPEMARQAEVEGTVNLLVLVGKDGRVGEVRVASGVAMLDEAALAAARRAIFRPALQQHRPVAVWVAVPMRFTLH